MISNKMLLLFFITLFLQFQGFSCTDPDANGIFLSEKVRAIERLMLTPGTIDFQVAPCDFLLNAPSANDDGFSGDQTSAEWVRIVFHDFVTANVTAGTGGLDASIGFESGRPENLGTIQYDGTNFIDRTIVGFNLFSSVFISTSDFIALGIAEAVLSCDRSSPMIQLKVGRIDATEAGPPGVPGPFDNVTVQAAAFANAGFTQTEMVQAVACGHSIGGVHGNDNPSIVGSDSVVGASKIDFFDETPYVFDVTGVQDYLHGTGKAGGPLVTSQNELARSDFRLFNADGNATIKAMAQSQHTFESTCFPIFQKMIDTVPSGTILSSPIGPSKWIVMHSNLDFNKNNAVVYAGQFGTYGKGTPPANAAYKYGTIGGGNTGPKLSGGPIPASPLANPTDDATRFPFFGNTTYYSFNDTLDSSVTSVTVGGIYTEAINQNLFVVPSMSWSNIPSGTGRQVLVRAALLSSLYKTPATLSGTLFYPAGQNGTVSITYLEYPFTLKFFGKRGFYSLFSASITAPDPPIPVFNGTGGAYHMVLTYGTQRTVAQVSWIGTNDFGSCTQSDLTQCNGSN